MNDGMFIIEAVASVDNRVILTDKYSNCFFEFLVDEGKVLLLGQFEAEKPMSRDLYERTVSNGKTIGFIPRNADTLSFLNVETEILESKKLPDEMIGTDGKFRTGVWVGDNVYLFGHYLNGIWKFNVIDNCFTKIFESNASSGLLFEDCYSIDGKIYAVSLSKDSLWIVDCHNDEVCEQKFSGGNSGYTNICANGRNLFLLPFCGDVIREYDIDSSETLTFHINEKINEWYIGGGYIEADKLLVFRRCDEPILSINTINHRKEYINVETEPLGDIVKRSFRSFGRPVRCGEHVICSIQKTGWMLIMDDNKARWEKVKVEADQLMNMQVDIVEAGVIEERPLFDLKRFIEEIKK